MLYNSVIGIGFIAVIHDNREMPILRHGHWNYHLARGTNMYQLGYTRKMHNLLGPPYSSCTQVTPYMLQALFDRVSEIDYSYREYMCYRRLLQCLHVSTTHVSLSCDVRTHTCVQVRSNVVAWIPNQWSSRFVVIPGTKIATIVAPFCNTSDPCAITNVTMHRLRSDLTMRANLCPECLERVRVCSLRNEVIFVHGRRPWMTYPIQ